MIRRLPRGPRLASRRYVLGAAAAACVLVALLAAAGAREEPVRPPTPLAERLMGDAWAFSVPRSWLATPFRGSEGDVLDLLGARASERAQAAVVASALRVIALDQDAIVVEITAGDAAALVEARARGLALVPILRPRR